MYILLLRKHQERCANMPYESHYIPFGRSEMQPRHFTLAKIEQLVHEIQQPKRIAMHQRQASQLFVVRHLFHHAFQRRYYQYI